MSEPPRLLDETDDEFVAGLLRAAQKQAPRRSSVNKTLLALGTSASLLGGPATAGAAATGASALAAPLVQLAAKWTLLGGVALGTAVTVVELGPGAHTYATGTPLTSTGAERPASPARGLPKREALPPHLVAPEPNAAVEAPAAPANTTPEPLPTSVPQGAVTESKRVLAERRDTVASPAGPHSSTKRRPAAGSAPPSEQLEQEVVLLDRATQALNHHEFEQALALADQYLARFVSGRLEPEARYLKMQAQRGLGDRSGASDEAERLLQVSPNGPHARAAHEVQRK